MHHFILYTDDPSEEFLAAVAALPGVVVRGWQQPRHYFSSRKSLRNSLKTKHGWINPNNVKRGDLRLSCDTDREPVDVFTQVIALGKSHGVDVHPGLMQTEG